MIPKKTTHMPMAMSPAMNTPNFEGILFLLELSAALDDGHKHVAPRGFIPLVGRFGCKGFVFAPAALLTLFAHRFFSFHVVHSLLIQRYLRHTPAGDEREKHRYAIMSLCRAQNRANGKDDAKGETVAHLLTPASRHASLYCLDQYPEAHQTTARGE